MISREAWRGALGPGELLVDVLGSGSGHPSAERDTTSLLVGSTDGYSLVECPGGIVHKLARRGLRPAELRRVILSHDHVDHIYGFPHLMHALAIAGETAPVEVAAPAQCLARMRAMIGAHALDRAHYPPVREVEIALEEGFELGSVRDGRIVCSPAHHGRDTVSMRFEVAGAALCYSADTRPCDALVRLARGCGLLLHDCAGPHRQQQRFADSHSSALEAGRAAAAAEVDALVLVHLGVSEPALVEECVREAAEAFDGEVTAACDGACWRLPRGD